MARTLPEMPKESTPKFALRWTPPGTKTTRRKTVTAELEDMGRGSGPIKGQDEDDMRVLASDCSGHGKDPRLPQWMFEKSLRDILAQ